MIQRNYPQRGDRSTANLQLSFHTLVLLELHLWGEGKGTQSISMYDVLLSITTLLLWRSARLFSSIAHVFAIKSKLYLCKAKRFRLEALFASHTLSLSITITTAEKA